MSSDIKLNEDQVVIEGILVVDREGTSITTLDLKGNLLLGGHGQDGDILLFPKDAEDQTDEHVAIQLDADRRSLYIRTNEGKVFVTLGSKGNLLLGGHGQDGDILLFPKDAEDQTDEHAAIQLDADAGDIKLRDIGSLINKIRELEDRIRELEGE